MTPEQAAADLVTGMGDCHQPIEAKPLARPCVFGDPAGDRTIVLVGDSKAQQWFPALDAAARSRGWRLLAWTKSSCALADVEFTSSRGGYAACAAWRNDVLGAIESEARSGGVDLVMIGRSRTYAGILVRNGTPISAPRDEAATWATAVRASLARIPDAGRIALLRDLPWALWDRAQCLSANPVATSQCAFAVTPDAREQALAKAERSVAATDPRVRTVDLTPLACPGGVCRAVSPAGIITFRDQHHLTATYSASLAAGLAKDVARLLNERKTPGA